MVGGAWALRARLGALGVLGASLACAVPAPGPPRALSDGRYVMGTVLEITLATPDAEGGRRLLEELFAVAERLDALLSLYRPESGLSKLNAAAGRGPQEVERELADLLRRSLRYSALTAGSFDVTIGPLVSLWTRAAQRGVPPTQGELAAVRERVGAGHVRVHDDGRVELWPEGVRVDLGGIAKGYALDRMLPLLERNGVPGALLNFGQSSTLAVGRPVGAPAWRLLARGPGERFLGVLELSGRALSVSGSLGQWVEIGGRRYGHVLDPRTGRALQRRRQALVVAPEAALAEALSKALLVLGEEEGLALVAGLDDCEALLADADGRQWRTPGWDAAVRWEPRPGPGLSRAPAPEPIRGRWRRSAARSAAPTYPWPATSAPVRRSSAPTAVLPVS